LAPASGIAARETSGVRAGSWSKQPGTTPKTQLRRCDPRTSRRATRPRDPDRPACATPASSPPPPPARARQAADWKPSVSASNLQSGNLVRGRGVAIGGFAGSYPAIIADITVNKKTGQIAVDHLYAAQDAGTTVNPASVENQMEGCLIQCCSRALYEQVRFSRVRQTSLDWITYPVIRFKDAPPVTTVVIQRLDLPSSGSGEPTTAAVPAAIANAFHDATGTRLYQMPMTPGLVRGALTA
jgi:nicotinate dehydrogenase subunit B